MKCRDFSSVLRTYADVLDLAGERVARDQMVTFAAVFDADPTLSVIDLAKRIAALPVAGSGGSPTLRDVARPLSALKGFLSRTNNRTVLSDFGAVEKLLHERASMELAAFVRMATAAVAFRRPAKGRGAAAGRDAPGMQDDLVNQYREKLEAALGDEEKFTAVYNDLCANPAIRKPEIIALAKQMMGGGGARTHDAALKKIWNRHQSLVVFKAKSRATGGRSAA
jgi:hypothetical protein